MNPIELRWLETADEARVLQYRFRLYRESAIPGLGGYGDWSEWQEVPVTNLQGFRVA
jgi:hypothetical protein